jgi:hypothetical protein
MSSARKPDRRTTRAKMRRGFEALRKAMAESTERAAAGAVIDVDAFRRGSALAVASTARFERTGAKTPELVHEMRERGWCADSFLRVMLMAMDRLPRNVSVTVENVNELLRKNPMALMAPQVLLVLQEVACREHWQEFCDAFAAFDEASALEAEVYKEAENGGGLLSAYEEVAAKREFSSGRALRDKIDEGLRRGELASAFSLRAAPRAKRRGARKLTGLRKR